MTDIFQEVEEDVRRERYEQIWKQYGHYIIAVAAVLVVGVAGYQIWKTYDLNQRMSASDRFQAAQQLAMTGSAPKAEEAFAGIVKDAPAGYALLAKFRLASAQLAQGKRDSGIALLKELIGNSDENMSAAARIRLAWAEADAQPRAEVTALLMPLIAADNPWHGAASEVLAYLELKEGSRVKAQDDYDKLSQDTTASEGLHQRAGAISAFLKANPTSSPVASPAAPAASGPPVSTQETKSK